MMKLNDLLSSAESILKNAQTENYKNEARWLLENDFGLKSGQLFLHQDDEADDVISEKYLSHIRERASGRPIQYILGSWDFYGREFAVGEGVLIPRPETEMLVDYALEYLKDKTNPVVLDLCAGSGCIGLTVAAERPDAKVTLVEKFPEAFRYLKINRDAIAPSAQLVCSDVLACDKLDLVKADLILSNPPYIRSDEISSLQQEVLLEPETALDGGEDGLIFYRALKDIHSRFGIGAMAVECGEDQADDIIEIFGSGYSRKDFNGIGRIVITEGE